MGSDTLKIENTFSYKCPPDKLYGALTSQLGIRNWWTDKCDIEATEKSEAHFYWNPKGWIVKMQIAMLSQNTLVKWHCIDSNMQDTDAWKGSEVLFQISSEGSDTSVLRFLHSGYKSSPCFQECAAGWSFVLGKSLKSYLENGRGMPFLNI